MSTVALLSSMRGPILVAIILASWVAPSIAATGVAVNIRVLPLQPYAGILEPGEVDQYPVEGTFAGWCGGGSQNSGGGVMLNVAVEGGQAENSLVLHTRTPAYPHSPTQTFVPADHGRASVATYDPLFGCPHFALESRALTRVAYVVVACWPLQVCPSFWG